MTDTPSPRFLITYGGADAFRGSEEVDAAQFIMVKGYKAKGKRLTTYQLESITELNPPEPEEDPETTEAPEILEIIDDPKVAETPEISEDSDSPEVAVPTPKKHQPEQELTLFDDEV